MRKLLNWGAAVTAGLVGSGCSIYPVTQDTTGLDTYDIVRLVRCETRWSVARYYVGIFLNPENISVPVYRGMTGQKVYDEIVARHLFYWDIDWEIVPKRIGNVWKYYGTASVSYDFNLDNTEMNAQGATLDVTRSLFGQTAKLPFVLRDDTTRQVTRNFRSFDTFEEMIKSRSLVAYCAGTGGYKNWRYPIAGDTNIYDLVTNFFNLNQSGNLYGTKDKDKDLAPTIADTIQFTTKTQANADPLLILNRVGSKFLPTDLTLNLDNYRQDLHKVIIAISLPPDKGGFTSAKLIAAGSRISGGTEGSRALGATELDRQQSIATSNAVQQIGQAVTAGARILP